ncbi:ester cyclase [Streptomyces sp. NPDC049040]|uniref:ester cyclase n=1 Tax=Streptomyces sp. NPDC049040 TaxID=3365593 RepID=UPI003724A857
MSTEHNKDVVRRYFEEFVNGRSLDVAEEILAEDAVDETRVGPEGTGAGREDFRVHARWLWESVEDAKTVLTDLIAEGDRVVAYWRLEGVQRAEIFGVPASGRRFSGVSISTFTLEDGRITRYKVLPDRLGVVRQLTGESA